MGSNTTILARPIFRDTTLDQAFWRDGFVQVPLLDEEQFAQVVDAFSRLRPADRFDPRNMANPRGSYHCTFLDPNLGYRREADALVRDLIGGPLRDLIPGYRILTSNIYAKPPGAGRFEIHQNWPTIDDLDTPTMTAWVPLQQTDFRNGGLRILRGGHRIFPDVAAATSDRFFDEFETELIENYLEPMTIAPGEVFVFDDSLLHWSGANLSDSPRVTFQVEVVPDDARTVLWIRDPDDPASFCQWEMDSEFWLTQGIDAVMAAPERSSLVRRVPNPNRRLTFAEFRDIYARRDEIRRDRFDFSAIGGLGSTI